MDSKLSLTAHTRKTAENVNVAVQKISRILQNVSVAKQGKRTLMSKMFHSLLQYGAPVWAGKMSAKVKSELIKVHMWIDLRVACVYCTISTDALNVVTSIPPFDLQVEARRLKISYLI